MCDFGVNGRISDGGVLQNTTFYELENKQLHMPSDESVKKSSKILPYVFVADDAFALRLDMMKPFRQADLNSKERKIYNYRCDARDSKRLTVAPVPVLSSERTMASLSCTQSLEEITSILSRQIARADCTESKHIEAHLEKMNKAAKKWHLTSRSRSRDPLSPHILCSNEADGVTKLSTLHFSFVAFFL
nr:unnamed protein product [Callosobruchus analis]